MAQIEFSEEAVRAALYQASAEIQDKIGALAVVAANTAKDRVQGAYPIGPTGNLRRQVFVSQPRTFTTTATGQPVPVWLVRATAPHVFIYQEGTKERFDSTRKGARRGRSPRHGRIFEAIAAQTRGDMLAQAQRLLDQRVEI